VTAVDGQHAGEIGEVEEIQVTPGSAENNVRIEREDGSIIETIEEYVVVIDENFVEDDEGVEAEDEAEADADAEADDEEAADADAEADEADADAEAEDADADEAEADGGDDE